MTRKELEKTISRLLFRNRTDGCTTEEKLALDELKSRGLLLDRTRRWWVEVVRAVLEKHGVQIY